mmetsp:Transcript_3641/g.9651  ORF Transcript_3641/g.9651 Transcript_3641/m.9651 type:complete len:196 (+) Transcript_3641:2145-2732(+)
MVAQHLSSDHFGILLKKFSKCTHGRVKRMLWGGRDARGFLPGHMRNQNGHKDCSDYEAHLSAHSLTPEHACLTKQFIALACPLAKGTFEKQELQHHHCIVVIDTVREDFAGCGDPSLHQHWGDLRVVDCLVQPSWMLQTHRLHLPIFDYGPDQGQGGVYPLLFGLLLAVTDEEVQLVVYVLDVTTPDHPQQHLEP